MSVRENLSAFSAISALSNDPALMEIIEHREAIEFSVRVIPRSSRSEIVGEYEGAVKVKLTSPPVDGAANAELIKLFAKKLGVSRSDVHIVSGETSKTKRLKVTGVTAEQLRNVLG
jgi:uncharacterized protein